jgi:CRP/FNR family cyclic AMP-dependent transcriptional regulator
VLLGHSCIVELEPGEKIMRRGDKGGWMYFLIKGHLDSTENTHPLNQIIPGGLFGDIALLCDHQRKATVAAGQGIKKALLFAIDFKPFRTVTDFNLIDLHTKLIFFRTMVHSIRWRLEVNRMEQPPRILTSELIKVPVFTGKVACMDKLHSLYEQAQFLARVLDRWNSGIVSVEGVMMTGIEH